MARKRFHNLKNPKIRADWSRWTLYNLSRAREPFIRDSFFKQKWLAKKMTRAYHGEPIREGKWELMFDRRLPAVVPMDGNALARTDGSEASAGRGSGVHTLLGETSLPRTPYSPMTYWPVERRLDTAVWRALFASSVLQARQFVVHGWVKVNGKTMQHPSYLLNPGDMFSVDPVRVMYATGARKDSKRSSSSLDSRQDSETSETSSRSPRDRSDGFGLDELGLESDEEDASRLSRAADKATDDVSADSEVQNNAQSHADPKDAVKALMFKARDILKDPTAKDKMSAKQKQAMRAFAREARSTMSRIRGDTIKTSEGSTSAQDTAEELEQAFAKLVNGDTEGNGANAADAADVAIDDISPARDAKLLRQALDAAGQSEEDAIEDAAADTQAESDSGRSWKSDPDKPYATPWRPREYMSAFAFIPRYLEVNQKICSAVYIRHPVARPGLAEVPAPYSEQTYELAHNWYLRRR